MPGYKTLHPGTKPYTLAQNFIPLRISHPGTNIMYARMQNFKLIYTTSYPVKKSYLGTKTRMYMPGTKLRVW
jgi:hypothetical protein